MTAPKVPLLLHSLAEFRQLIMGCLDVTGAKRVVEIGGEDGTFTRELLDWADPRGASVVCIDPAPPPTLEQLAAERPGLALISQASIPALETLEPADAYLIDGDHNYFTVNRELRLIWRADEPSSHLPIVFIHDVGWPSGRRDQYYDPAQIPAEHRHELTWDHGVVVDEPGVVAGGFRGEGEFAVAVREGGPRNGVLTAVEDFLVDRPELSLTQIPAVFGLGVIHHREAAWASTLTDLLGPYAESLLLRRLEDNRLVLYLTTLEMQDRLAALGGQLRSDRQLRDEVERCLRQRDLLLRDAQVENRALWRRLEELEAATHDPAEVPRLPAGPGLSGRTG